MNERMTSDTAAILVIDLQTGMFDGVAMAPLHDAEALTARVREVLAWARGSGRKVAFVRHDGSAGEALAPGAAGWPVWPALGQAPDEPTFSKSVGDAFSNPELAVWLADQGAAEVVLMGAQTDECVAATTAGALAAGLKVTLVSDAHSTWPWAGETAQQIIDRHNAKFAADGATLVSAAVVTAQADASPNT
jgi:nicotinamidase-related amidase